MPLTSSELADIRELMDKGVSLSVIAIKYELSKECVRALKNNRPYKHLL